MGLKKATRKTGTKGTVGKAGTHGAVRAVSHGSWPFHEYTHEIGRDIYLSQRIFYNVWFEYRGTGTGSGNDLYYVHGNVSTGQLEQFFNNIGLPYQYVRYDFGAGVVVVFVPGGALNDMNWPWTRALGYC